MEHPIKTSNMKLSEIRPCDQCGGPLGITFRLAEVRIAVIDPSATRETLGLTQMLHGSLALAEAMGARAHEAVKVCEEDVDKIFLCTSCYCGKVNLAALVERICAKREEAANAVK